MRVNLSGIDCVSYSRVSDVQQAGEKQTTFADQDAAVAALASSLKRTIGHAFQDKGISGATMDQRPALKSLIASCLASPRTPRQPGYVLVLNDSRWGRFPDPEESTYWRVHLSKHAGWIVRFAENDDSDSKTVRAIMRAVVSGQATQKRDDVKANSLRGAKGTTAQGFWVGSAPFGYRRAVVYPPGRERVLDLHARKAPDEKMALVPHAEEAAVVAHMFAMYASGEHSVGSVTEWVLQACPGRKWNRASVRYTLNNPAYVGDLVWGRVGSERDGRGMRLRRPEGEWYGKSDAHPRIVSRATFARVQAILRRNASQRRGVRSDWIISGIVSCRCGQPFCAGGGGGRGGRVPVYRCCTRGQHPSARCPYRGTIVKHYLEDAVLSTLASVLGTPLHRRELAARFNANVVAGRKSGRTVEAIDREIAALKSRQSRLVAAIESDTISSLDAKERMAGIRTEILRLAGERETAIARAGTPALAAAERERLVALALDFRTAAARLKGPALRELIRPWIKRAEFDTSTRELTMEIRRIPTLDAVLGLHPVGSSAQTRRELTVIRRVRVGRLA